MQNVKMYLGIKINCNWRKGPTEGSVAMVVMVTLQHNTGRYLVGPVNEQQQQHNHQ